MIVYGQNPGQILKHAGYLVTHKYSDHVLVGPALVTETGKVYEYYDADNFELSTREIIALLLESVMP